MMKELWPGWETVEAIGAGGFSKVYKIRKQDSSDTGDYLAALKIISIPQSPEEYESYALEGFDDNTITGIFTSQVKRIVEEFRLMSQFKGNSNIVSYEDHMIVPHEDGRGWDILIRMELLESLPRYCNRTALNEEETIKLGVDICRALELCQKKNIIHRDIKPQNIFVNEFGDYKLGDFGIAKSMDHTTHATKIGTYSYMAPEVYRGEAYGATIDLYSLGLVMYWLLNERRLPFLPLPPGAPTAAQLNEAQVRRLSGEALPAPKHGSDELKRIVLKACAYNAADRYATPAAMRRDLERALVIVATASEEATGAAPAETALATEPTMMLANEEEKTESLIFQTMPMAAVSAGAYAEEEDRTEAMPFAAFSAADETLTESTVGLPPDPETTVGLFGERTAKVSAEPLSGASMKESVQASESVPAFAPAPMAPKQSRKGKWLIIIGGVLLVIVVVLLLLKGCWGGADVSYGDANKFLEEAFGSSLQTTADQVGHVFDQDVTISANAPVTNEPVTEPVQVSSEGLEFELNDDGTYRVVGIGTCTDTDVVIPATYNGKAVTVIGKSAFNVFANQNTDLRNTLHDINSVTLPESILTIDMYAFQGCMNLTSVKLGGNLEHIGEWAFGACSNLRDITIPNGVISIGEWAFSGSSIESIIIPDSVTDVGQQLFTGCEELYEVTLGAGITGISRCMFQNCTALTSVAIPDTINHIGSGAFFGCENLTSVVFQRTAGWYVGSTEDEICGVPESLSDPETAAKYLTGDFWGYAEYNWYRDVPVFSGKTFVFLGSSVTDGAAAGGWSMADYISEEFDCTVVKWAVSGTTLTDDSSASYVQRMINGMRYQNACDHFIVELSTNDATQEKPLGTLSDSTNKDDFDTNTIIGAIEYLIASAKEKWNCEVSFYTNTRYDSIAYQKMVDALDDVAEKWGIGIIDLWDDPEMNAVSSTDYNRYMSDPIHPTKIGYKEWWGPKFADHLNYYE